jgi:hypothetical protein
VFLVGLVILFGRFERPRMPDRTTTRRTNEEARSGID